MASPSSVPEIGQSNIHERMNCNGGKDAESIGAAT